MAKIFLLESERTSLNTEMFQKIMLSVNVSEILFSLVFVR